MSNKHCFSHLVPYDISSPEFLKRLQCEDAVEGERATLSCQVVGDPAPRIQWFKEDGKEILESDQRYIMSYSLETGTAQLIIKYALTIDEMSYKCVASNQYGTSKTIGVLVVKANKSKPKSPTQTLTPPTASGAVRSNSPLRNIDVPVSNLPPVKEESEISSSEADDSKLKSTLNATVEEPKKSETYLIEKPPPEKIEVKEGEDIKICCTISGTPELEISWFKDGKSLKDDYRIDIYNDRGARYLEICDVKMSDAGEYTLCVPSDAADVKINASTKVIVFENPQKLKRPIIEGLYQYGSRQETYRPPQFIIKPTNQTIHEGKKLVIFSKFTGVPKPEISWFRDGKPLKSESDNDRYKIYNKDDCNYFEIDNVSILDTGEYTCTASNVMGAVYSAINIIVEAMTEPETGTSSEVYSDLEKSAQDSENRKSFSDYNTDTSVSVKLVGPL